MTAITPATGGIGTTSLRDNSARGSRKVKNGIACGLVYASFGLALIPLIWLLYTVIDRGWKTIVKADWWNHSQRNITLSDSNGGAYHAILGTAEQVLICTVISVPIAIMVGIYLVEYGRGRIAKVTSFAVDILTGIPSIVAALFIYAVFITSLGGHRKGVLVSLALVMLMVPTIVRTTEEMLKLVPNEIREASYALGVSKWVTILRVVIPTARSGIVTGIMLGIARVAGETAPLLVLVGYNANINADPFKDNQGSLPGLMYDQTTNLGDVRFHFAADRMWGAALTLIIIVMVLNLIARLIASTSKVSR